MKISLKWLNSLLEQPIIPSLKTHYLLYSGFDMRKLAETGLEVDAITKTQGKTNDIIIEFDTTPNRNDINSIYGFINEIESSLNLNIKKNKWKNKENQKSFRFLKNKINPQKCLRKKLFYSQIFNFKTVKTPKWLANRIQALGVEPTNSSADILNYISLEWGVPIQIYDIDKIKKFLTQNGQKSLTFYKLAETASTDKDLDLPVTLSVIGKELEVDETTTSVLIEYIHFTRDEIKTKLQKSRLDKNTLKLYSKGFPDGFAEAAYQRTLKLFKLLHPNTRIETIVLSTKTDTDKTIKLRHETLNKILGPTKNGTFITRAEVDACFKKLKLKTSRENENCINVTIPQFRKLDLEQEIDLIEEVGRTYGFDFIASKLTATNRIGTISTEEWLTKRLKSNLISIGFIEIVSFSLMPGGKENQYQLLNPLGLGAGLRVGIIENLLKTLEYNLKQQNTIVRGFEIGRAFDFNNKKETNFLSGFLYNETKKLKWDENFEKLDWYCFKNEIEETLKPLLKNNLYFYPIKIETREFYNPQHTAIIFYEGQEIGFITETYGNKKQNDTIYFFEINLTLLGQLYKLGKTEYKEFSTYPGITRDITFVSPKAQNTHDYTNNLKKTIKGIGGLSPEIKLKDVYNTPKKKAVTLTYSFYFKAKDRTLKREEIDKWMLSLTKLMPEFKN